ncbi:hypothetical protein N7471_002258 [Penicillium samsonianum]|uniref:uncharacterized protein n=1 Tax=Penicillium samsonianum TaxID=1882272 RepID=UPI002548C717|nr:uncharacterized protein N7471_002258 [Penicillium samsonianum]KAJ6142805.1 hypothetical protein N7471_002258 [Penicillium samsonianum]
MASSKLEYLLSDAETEDEDGDLPVVLPKPLPELLRGRRPVLEMEVKVKIEVLNRDTSAGVHESLLRVFIDPETEGAIEASFSMDGSAHDININDSINGFFVDGEQVRQHPQLLKLSMQRLGD